MTRSTNPKIVHSMLCSESSPVHEVLVPDATGQMTVVAKCSECGRDDQKNRQEVK